MYCKPLFACHKRKDLAYHPYKLGMANLSLNKDMLTGYSLTLHVPMLQADEKISCWKHLQSNKKAGKFPLFLPT